MKAEDQLAGLCVANAELGLVVLDYMAKCDRLRAVAMAARDFRAAERKGDDVVPARMALARAQAALQPGDLDGLPRMATLREGSADVVEAAAAEAAGAVEDIATLAGRRHGCLTVGRDALATLDAEPPDELLAETRPPACPHLHVAFVAGNERGECLDCHTPLVMGDGPVGVRMAPAPLCSHPHTQPTTDGAAEVCPSCGLEV